MNRLGLTIGTIPMAIVFCLASGLAISKDITNEQRNAYEAREAYNKRKSEHAALTKHVMQQEQRVAQEQARLDQLKADEAQAQTAVEKAKVNLDQSVKALNDVWEFRSQ